jgi:hypothetical protein
LLADVGASFNFDFNDYLHPLPYAWFPILTQHLLLDQLRSPSLSGRELFHLFCNYPVFRFR